MIAISISGGDARLGRPDRTQKEPPCGRVRFVIGQPVRSLAAQSPMT